MNCWRASIPRLKVELRRRVIDNNRALQQHSSWSTRQIAQVNNDSERRPVDVSVPAHSYSKGQMLRGLGASRAVSVRILSEGAEWQDAEHHV